MTSPVPLAARSIQTARLLLRPFAPADIPAYAAIRAKADVVRHLPGGIARAATAQADAERMVPSFAAMWDEPGYGPWAAIDRSSGALLGHVGLRLLPDLGGETEVLYMLDSSAWGRGLATEGAAAARDFGFTVLGLRQLIGLALPANVASQRVLEKLGMQRIGTQSAFGLDVVRFVQINPRQLPAL